MRFTVCCNAAAIKSCTEALHPDDEHSQQLAKDCLAYVDILERGMPHESCLVKKFIGCRPTRSHCVCFTAVERQQRLALCCSMIEAV